MKNYRSIRILLALLLSLCMLFSGIPVFALEDGEEVTTDYVTVTLNDEGKADIAVTIGEVKGDCGTGIDAHVSEGYPDVSADGYEGLEGQDLISEEMTYEMDKLDDMTEVSSLSVSADSVKEEVVLLPDNRIGYEEHLEMHMEGISGRSSDGTALSFQVEEGVQLTIHNDPERENKGESETFWTGDSVTAEGIYVETDQADLTIATGDVNVDLQYTDTNEEETWIYANLTGVDVEMNADDDYGHTGAPESEEAKGDVSVGNVTVTAETDTAEPELNLTGIEATAGPGASMVLEAGDVTINGTASGDAVSEEYLSDLGDGENTLGVTATGISTSQNVDATVGKINIELSATGKDFVANGRGIFAGGEGDKVQAESVTMTAASEGTAYLAGIYAESEAEVAVENDVSLSAEGKDAYAFGVEAGRSASVETGGVKAEAKAEVGEARAIAVSIRDSCFEADGDVKAISNGVTTANSYGVLISGDSKAMIHGDVTAEASADEEGGGYAVGVHAQGLNNTVTTAEIDGDVTADIDGGAGIVVEYGELSSYEGEDGKEEAGNEAPTVNVLVNGTVSGASTAIEVMENDRLSAEDVNLTLWAAEENEDKQIAAVYSDEARDGNFELNETASKALEAAINYIVKFTESLTFKDISTEKGNTVEAFNETWHTANEGELVAVKAEDTDEKTLEGIYYNADKEDSLQEAAKLEKDSSGNYLVKMMRGGAMNLNLKWHVHIYDTREKDRVEPTCTEDGSVVVETYCTGCGKVAVTEKKTLPKTGHTAGEAKKEKETAATCKAEGGNDLVTCCEKCGAEISREHVTIDKLAHTPGEPVVENEVPATERTNGSYDRVVYCTACGAEISRETLIIPKTQNNNNNNNSNNNNNNNNNGSKKETDGSQEVLQVVIVAADSQSETVLTVVNDAEKAGDILAFLPEEVRKDIPEGYSKVSTRNAMKIIGDIEEVVSFDAVFEFETPFTAGDTVYLLIGASDEDGTTTWYLLEGEANEDGNVVASLTNLLTILGNRQFVVLTVTK